MTDHPPLSWRQSLTKRMIIVITAFFGGPALLVATVMIVHLIVYLVISQPPLIRMIAMSICVILLLGSGVLNIISLLKSFWVAIMIGLLNDDALPAIHDWVNPLHPVITLIRHHRTDE